MLTATRRQKFIIILQGGEERGRLNETKQQIYQIGQLTTDMSWSLRNRIRYWR